MTVLKWDFKKLSTDKYETNTYEINESFKDISVKSSSADVVLVPSNGAESSVVCYERKNTSHSVEVREGRLVIEAIDTRKWYEHIEIMSFDTPKITINIPQGEYGALSVNVSTGDVKLPKEYSFKSIDISGSTGDVKCYASAKSQIKIKQSTGNINAENLTAEAIDFSVSTGKISASSINCNGDIRLKVTTGKTKLSDINCKNLTSSGNTGDIDLKNVVSSENLDIKRSTGYTNLASCSAGKLNIKTDTGDVRLDACDAGEILIETDTGDVKGSLLSDKVFITKTDTGRVDVPKTITGGRCEITTDTGDIIISVEKQ
jgi:DUF4097 and DUF4098 domain-containing protein YvlB